MKRAGANVLLLEDSVILAMAMEEELTERGHTVCTAATVSAAEQCLAESSGFAVALLDMRLPDGTPGALARKLQAAGCAVALVSGVGADEVPGDLAHLPLFRKPTPLGLLADWVDGVLRPQRV
jgi:DNA-binding NtrC family response regulator